MLSSFLAALALALIAALCSAADARTATRERDAREHKLYEHLRDRNGDKSRSEFDANNSLRSLAIVRGL